MSGAHETLVAAQFGAHARAYVESADHAIGADLNRLTALVEARPASRVLDLGCGGGHVSFAVARPAAEVVAYDLSLEMLTAVRGEAAARGLTNIRFEQGSAEALPFADASFDVVLTRFSAHHWSNLAAGLGEMRRVLKPGGRAVVIDTMSPGRPVLHDTFLQAVELLRDPTHVRDYSRAEWHEALCAAGFKPLMPIMGQLRLEFARWVARIGTPPLRIDAIRDLQSRMPDEVRRRFELAADGSFTLDTIWIEAET